VRIRDGEIFFDWRLHAREVENLPSTFAQEAQDYTELGAAPGLRRRLVG
jgi:hypothetical protein